MKRIFMFLVLLLASGSAEAGYQIGETPDDFTLPLLHGGELSLFDHLGDIVVLNFFTTWCEGCNEEAHSLQHDIWEGYRDRGLVVLAVDIQEPPPLVQGWVAANDLDYTVLLAPNWDLQIAFDATGYGIIPYNVVMDRSMTVLYSLFGYDLSALTGIIETILDDDGETASGKSSWGAIKTLYD
jgi:peroxiredoxin